MNSICSIQRSNELYLNTGFLYKRKDNEEGDMFYCYTYTEIAGSAEAKAKEF